ncbi:MAG: hypothetical protein KDB68_05465 [Planctomycetes bacterium]|nr:hypothetical protein [Planctomycetota bacterium]MCA8935635.1 hypothetical protein [Planctomycetota bacterium]
MKTPPDEKAVETLSASSRDRKPGGKWRVIILVTLTLVLLVSGSLVALESYRQAGINEKRAEFMFELSLAEARYADVKDWPQWYKDQLPADCVHAPFEEWVAHCEQGQEGRSQLAERINRADIGADGSILFDSPAPTVAELEKFIDDTEQLSSEAAELLQYQHLSILPPFENGLPSPNWSPNMALRMLIQRSVVFRYLGLWEKAWNDATTAMRLYQRWDYPTSYADALTSLVIETYAHETISAMVSVRTPPLAVLRGWLEQPSPPTDYGRRLLELVYADTPQYMKGFDADDEESWKWFSESTSWFDYMNPRLDWEERKATFAGHVALIQLFSQKLRAMRTVLETPHGDLSDLDSSNPLLSGYTDYPKHVFELGLLRQTTALMSRVLLARRDGNVNTVMVQAAADFPDHEVFIDGADTVVRVRYGKDLLARLPNEYADEEEFYEVFEPVRIPLKP